MAKRKKEEPPVYSVWVGVKETHISGGEPDEPGEQWTSHSTEYRGFNVTGVFLESPQRAWDHRQILSDIELKAGDEAYVVVVRYSTGDTFSHSTGNGKVLGVHPNKLKAQEEVDLIHSGKHPEHYTWDGYFERLEDVEVYRKMVQAEENPIQGANFIDEISGARLIT